MSLTKLLALQAQKKSTESNRPTTASSSQPVVSEAESQTAEQGVTPTSPPAKPKGLGLNLASAYQKPDGPMPIKTPASAKPAPAEPAKIDSDSFSLSDLAATSAGTVEVLTVEYDNGFVDEIEATAPDRDLPPDLTAEQLSFVESLDGIYGVLHDPAMFGQAVRMIMMELQENQEYDKLLSDPDIHTMIRGMRRTMGMARVKKQEKSRKPATQKNARKTSGVSDSAMQLLDQLMGGGDDD